MKKSIILCLAFALICVSAGFAAPQNPIIRVSTTTSVNDSGLLAPIQEAFEKQSGYKLEITSKGSGAAIKLGETGDTDLLIVHSPAAEKDFIAAGWGIVRIPFMHNYFVIAGPKDDPADVQSAKDATVAFKAIAEGTSEFVSRGDESGTHNAELKIWKAAEITPHGDWYISAGDGMGACLTQANERQAYIFTDLSTFLSMADKLELDVLMSESEALINVYSLISVNPEQCPSTNVEGVQALIDFMTGPEGSAIIENYGIEKYGQPLFFLGDGSKK